jgi:hypothetical protein
MTSDSLTDETLREILNEMFNMAEEFFLSAEFSSMDVFSFLNSLEENDHLRNIFQEEEFSEGTAKKTKNNLQQFIQTLTPQNLQSKGLEIISIARDSIDEIVRFIRHPKELLRLFTQSLPPETIHHFKSFFPNGMTNELKEFLRNSFEIQEEEFQEMVLPFHELISELESLMSDEKISSAGGMGGGGLFREMLPQSEDLDEITGESIQEMLKLFHDPKQVLPSF